MLFDLRGRGRRRTVQVVYVCLAIVFGLGFVGFGVGVGGGGGGILNFLSEEKSSGSATFDAQIKKDRKTVAAQPNNPAPLGNLIKDILRQAGTGENYNQTEGSFTDKASGLLHEANTYWQRYLALDNNPGADVASLMLQVFGGPGGLNEPAGAVAALQIVIAARPPSEALYADLAEFAYKAHNTRQGDLASEKAVGLAPKAERKKVKEELEAVKKNPTGSTTAGASASGSTPNAVTVNGNTSQAGTSTVSATPTQKAATSPAKKSKTTPATSKKK